jgi:hypothetical protein
MTGLCKTLLIAGAAGALGIMVVIETPFAQNSGAGRDPAKSIMQLETAPDAAATAADRKAEASMRVPPNSFPTTDADRRAAAAMEMGSTPAPPR